MVVDVDVNNVGLWVREISFDLSVLLELCILTAMTREETSGRASLVRMSLLIVTVHNRGIQLAGVLSTSQAPNNFIGTGGAGVVAVPAPPPGRLLEGGHLVSVKDDMSLLFYLFCLGFFFFVRQQLLVVLVTMPCFGPQDESLHNNLQIARRTLSDFVDWAW